MEKEKYVEVNFEIIIFETKDVITDSCTYNTGCVTDLDCPMDGIS